jgi:hypothetical protein
LNGQRVTFFKVNAGIFTNNYNTVPHFTRHYSSKSGGYIGSDKIHRKGWSLISNIGHEQTVDSDTGITVSLICY